MVFGVACSNRSINSDEFLIEGKLSGVDDGVVIGLWDGSMVTDTIKNGRFRFTGKAGHKPEVRAISVRDDGAAAWQVFLWIEAGAKIKIKGKSRMAHLWKVKSSVPYQKEQNRYDYACRDIRTEPYRICLEYEYMRRKHVSASSEEESLAYKKIADSLWVVFRSLNNDRTIKESYINISIMEKTDISQVWLRKLSEIAGRSAGSGGVPLSAEQTEFFREKALELYDRMSEEDRNTEEGNRITGYLFPTSYSVVDVGDDMADADLLDANGNTKRLSDYLGKYILLDFWHSGCAPCIKAFPEIKEISEIYRDKLTAISITLDSDSRWKAITARHDMPWVNLRDPKSSFGLASNYGIKGTPSYIMISPEGKIIDRWDGISKVSLKEKVSENIK
jgi:peroxiredoxin